MPLGKSLGLLAFVVGVLTYLGAVAGVFFAAATPPLDVGASSVLVIGLLFALLGFAVARVPASSPPAPTYR